MRKSRYSDEQIAAALRQAEIGTPVADITRKLGILKPPFKFGRNDSARSARPKFVSYASYVMKTLSSQRLLPI